MCRHEHRTWTSVFLPTVLNTGNFLELCYVSITHGEEIGV